MIHLELPREIPNFSDIIDLCCERDVKYKQRVLNSKDFCSKKETIIEI
ncbi:Uncharacterised protein [Actinobacillus equuli]|nr:Uncharacterised protein [Actinobacillus equuli]